MRIPDEIYKRIVRAKRFIDENFQEPIDLDAIAGEACLSRFHFHRLFRRIYRRTPHEYLTRRRIGEALRMLQAEQYATVGAVCAQVGFESIGSFSMLFKKATGVAPGEYRERCRIRRTAAAEQPRLVIPYCFIDEIAGEKSNNQEGRKPGME